MRDKKHVDRFSAPPYLVLCCLDLRRRCLHLRALRARLDDNLLHRRPVVHRNGVAQAVHKVRRRLEAKAGARAEAELR